MGASDHIALDRVTIDLTILIGAVDMPLGRALRLGRGAVIPLGRRVDEPLTVLAGGAPVGYASVVLRGERIAVAMRRERPPAPVNTAAR